MSNATVSTGNDFGLCNAGGSPGLRREVACYKKGSNFVYRLERGKDTMRLHVGYTITGMSCNNSGTHLILHLQSPAAAAAAQQAAEADIAAVEADSSRWLQHEASTTACNQPSLHTLQERTTAV
jgi:hypothetical protein